MRSEDVTATRDCEGIQPSETGRGAVALLHAAGDPASFRAWSDDLRPSDLLGFVDRVPYAERLRHARSITGVDEAFVAGELRVHGLRVAAGAYEYAFIGGGMGSVVGERISRLFHRAAELRLPVFVVHRSGGARMQEGTWSLLQMAKVCAAIAEHRDAGLPYVSYLMDPCMGGALASSGSLGDVLFAEPEARIGFAGARVTWAALGLRTPDGLQRTETLHRNGFVDRVVALPQLRAALSWILGGEYSGGAGRPWEREPTRAALPATVQPPRMETIRASRRWQRPRLSAWLDALFRDFFELHGDRCSGDDLALRGGIARFRDRRVVVIGQDRGKTVAELRERNFGMGQPCGFRKAARLVRLAERLRLPVVTVVDTPGASPLAEAEEGGQAFAIAEATQTMAHARTPTLGVVIGEGASGGAIPLASVDFLIALENTHLSVISPEGCAGILWRNRHHAPEAADELRSTARDLARDGIVDRLIPEPDVPAVLPVGLVAQVGQALEEALESLEALGTDRLVERRRARFHRDAARIRGAPVVDRAGSP